MNYHWETLRKFASFVPAHKAFTESDAQHLFNFIKSFKNLVALTGAGISTESGLPDYRSEDVGVYARNKNFVPVQYQRFVKSAEFRQRYWLKNYLGWTNLYNLNPNDAHLTLAKLQDLGKVTSIITQNVDNLHQKAKSRDVINLHGTAYHIICLSCPFSIDRPSFQGVLQKNNSSIVQKVYKLNPDGDVDIPSQDIESFVVPDCPDCGGILKPDIVFFGENVPRQRVDRVNSIIERSDSLLVIGSSLTVQSSYRIVRAAHEQNKPVAILNIGRTRADELADIKIETKCGSILPIIYERLAQQHREN